MTDQSLASHLTILCIDDNQDNGFMLSRRLKRLGVNCVTTTRPREAIRLIIEHQPDLVLLDLNMPYVSGFEVLKKIRATDSIASTLVWAFTANSLSKTRQACVEAGFDGFLAKPIVRQDLERIMDQFAPYA